MLDLVCVFRFMNWKGKTFPQELKLKTIQQKTITTMTIEKDITEARMGYMPIPSPAQHWGGPVLCLVAQSCPTLCDSMDCSPPGFSVHGDSPGKDTGVGCMPSNRGSSQPRDWTQISCTAGRLFTVWATREVVECMDHYNCPNLGHMFTVAETLSHLSSTCLLEGSRREI